MSSLLTRAQRLPPSFLTVAVAAGALLASMACSAFVLHVADTRGTAQAAGGILGALFVAWCLTTRHPLRAVFAACAFLALADGWVRLQLNTPSAGAIRDMVMYSAFLNLALRSGRARVSRRLPPFTLGVVLFVAIIVVELANPGTSSVKSGLAGLRVHLEFVPLFFVGAFYVRSLDDVVRVLWFLVIVGVANSLVNFVQFSLTPAQFAGWGPGYHERLLGGGQFSSALRVAYDSGTTGVRPFGLGSDIGFGGEMAAIGIPAAAALALIAKSSTQSLLCAAAAVVMCGGALTAGARAVTISAVLAALFFVALSAASREAPRLVAVLAVIAAAGALLAPPLFKGGTDLERLKSIAPSEVLATSRDAREGSIRLIPTYATRYPVGAGLGRTGSASQFVTGSNDINAENEMTFMIAEGGLLGSLVITGLYLRVLWLATLGVPRAVDRRMKIALRALAAPIFGAVGIWLAAPTTSSPPFAPFFWLTAGIVTGVAWNARRPAIDDAHRPLPY